VYKVRPDGTQLTQLTDSSEYDGEPAWSPDSNQIVFVSKRSGIYALWVMDASGGNLQQITYSGAAYFPSWSPSGEWIAYSNDQDANGWLELYRLRPDGSEEQTLYTPYDTRDAWGASWSPDEEWLTFNETNWVQYEGECYWTESYLDLIHVDTLGLQYLTSDNRVWRSSWTTTDIQAPGPCTVDIPAFQRQSSIFASVYALDNGASGVATYDLQARRHPGGIWQENSSRSSSQVLLYESPWEGQIDLRCRAIDQAGNEADWSSAPVISTTVDSLPPQSQTNTSAPAVRPANTIVEWQGTDTGSGVESYDVFYRPGTQGDWTLWQDDTQNTSAVFNGSTGTIYYFRTQAVDKAGHSEPWQPAPQAEVSFFSTLISGTLTDIRGFAVPFFEVTTDPPAMYSQTDPTGSTFQLYLAPAITHTLSTQAPGYGMFPATVISTSMDTSQILVLPPDPAWLVNGGFESTELTGWTVDSSGAQVVSDTYHSGGYSLQIEHGVPVTTTLVQPVYIDPSLNQPTLSLFYYLPNNLTSAKFSVEISAMLASTVLSTVLANGGWEHIWADLGLYAGQTITISLSLAGGPGEVRVDDMALGAWEMPGVQAVSPQEWLTGEAPLLTISGTNFLLHPPCT